jgi:hypothetical protein
MRNNMKKVAKILKNLSGRIVGNRSTLFFPMTTLETEDTSGTSLLLEVSTPAYGSTKPVLGAVMRENSDGIFFRLAYVSPGALLSDIDLVETMKVLGSPLSRKESDILSAYSPKIVTNEAILLEIDNKEW